MSRPVPLLAVAAALALAACTPKSSDTSCPSGQERCRGSCVDPAAYATDAANCGGCGHSCATGASCASGVCACPTGKLDCAGHCVDLASDGANCGACGIACGLGACVAGTCQCDAGTTTCASTVPRCVDGLGDPSNCGIGTAACGKRCALANEVCDAGTCACPTGTTACPAVNPTACVDLASDGANCGGCGTRCATGQTCVSGACQCPAGESVCGGVCVNRSTDEANCGACGWVCPVGIACTAGSCSCSGTVQPLLCGVPGAGGRCCAGNGCCPNDTCQTAHANGVGQSFYDCLALGTYTLAQAEKAAGAWQPSGTEQAGVEFSCSGCIGWHATVNSISYCGTWCYSGSLAGRAMVQQSLLCGCPFGAAQTWN